MVNTVSVSILFEHSSYFEKKIIVSFIVHLHFSIYRFNLDTFWTNILHKKFVWISEMRNCYYSLVYLDEFSHLGCYYNHNILTIVFSSLFQVSVVIGILEFLNWTLHSIHGNRLHSNIILIFNQFSWRYHHPHHSLVFKCFHDAIPSNGISLGNKKVTWLCPSPLQVTNDKLYWVT